MRRRGEILVAGCMLLAACGLDAVGTGPSSNGERGGSGGDGGGGGADGATADTGAGCVPDSSPACIALPPDWRFVAVGPTSAACPPETGAPADVGEEPAPAADACSCSTCSITQPPPCTGQVTIRYSYGTGACGQSATNVANDPPGACLGDHYSGDITGVELGYSIPTPSGGECSASAVVARNDRVTYAATSRLCEATARCSGGTCDMDLPGPHRACVARQGDHPCPASFPARHVVGASASVACPACACTVATRTCTMRLFNASNCTGSAIDIPLDDVCRESGAVGAYQSYRVNGAATCALTAASPPASSVSLVGSQTVCCR